DARQTTGAARRRTIQHRAAARTAARSFPRGADRGRREAGVAQSDPRDARGLLRAAGHASGNRDRRPRPGSERVEAVSSIAVNVFRESVRDKVLYNLVFFAILLMAASFLIGSLTAGQDIKIIKD